MNCDSVNVQVEILGLMLASLWLAANVWVTIRRSRRLRLTPREVKVLADWHTTRAKQCAVNYEHERATKNRHRAAELNRLRTPILHETLREETEW